MIDPNLAGEKIPQCDVCNDSILSSSTYRQWFTGFLFNDKIDQCFEETELNVVEMNTVRGCLTQAQDITVSVKAYDHGRSYVDFIANMAVLPALTNSRRLICQLH